MNSIDGVVDFKVLEKVVKKQYPEYSLLRLKMPGVVDYYPVVLEDDILEVWIVKNDDAIKVDIKCEDYINAK